MQVLLYSEATIVKELNNYKRRTCLKYDAYCLYFGKVIDQVSSPEDTLNYIVLKGDNANLGYAEILDELYLYPEIYKQIDSLNRIAQRRWDVLLKGNVLIKLPEGKITGALANFKLLNLHEHYLEICKEIDLRFMPDKIYIKF